MTGRPPVLTEAPPPDVVYVWVSPELVAQLTTEWSPKLQVKIERRVDNRLELVFRREYPDLGADSTTEDR